MTKAALAEQAAAVTAGLSDIEEAERAGELPKFFFFPEYHSTYLRLGFPQRLRCPSRT